MQIAYALADLPLPPARKSPLRIIDIGCGQGAASCAVIDKLRTAFPSCEIEVCLLDHSAKALSLAKSLIEREYPKITVRAHCVDLQRRNPISALFPPQNTECPPFDIAVSSHLINELFQRDDERISKRFALIADLAQFIAADGVCLLLEPALLRTSRDLLALRDRILSVNLFRVISPCPHNFPCPALAAGESHTCHAEYPFLDVGRVKSLARDAGLEREQVKMTYFLLRRESSPCTPSENASAVAPFALPQNSLSGIVVSDAMTNKSCRVRFLICANGRRVAVSAKEGDPRAAEIGFFALKRMYRVHFSALEERRSGDSISFGITNQTSLEITLPPCLE